MKKKPLKTVWLWTKAGGQIGIDYDNIDLFNHEYVKDKKGTRYELDPNRWYSNYRAITREFP